VCVGAPEGATQDVFDRFRARAPTKHALCGEVAGRPAAIVAAHGPLRGEQLAEALRGVVEGAIHVGEGEPVDDLRDAALSHRHALAALKAATDRDVEVARWEELRAHRLLTALPPTVLSDLPPGIRKLLDGGHEQLVLTLETYLDHAGDVKRTAAELWLHRTSLYYRLRRIEEIAGVDLTRGEDRLLCHVALRLDRLAKSA
jgi:DNA-binding PucR family transcriptional regulator